MADTEDQPEVPAQSEEPEKTEDATTPPKKWGLLKKAVVSEEKQPKGPSDAFVRLVKQKAREEGLAMPFAEAIRKQELKTRRVSTMKFTKTNTYDNYKTRNAPTEKSRIMERQYKEKPAVRGAADRGSAGVSFSRDPYAYLRTPNADITLPQIQGSPNRSKSVSPTKMMGSPGLPSVKSSRKQDMSTLMPTRSSSVSPTPDVFLRTPPGRWRPQVGVPSIIRENGNWCSSWKFTKISTGYRPAAATLSMSPIPQRDPRVLEAMAARMGENQIRSQSISPSRQRHASPGQLNPLSPNKYRVMPSLGSPDRDRSSAQGDR